MAKIVEGAAKFLLSIHNQNKTLKTCEVNLGTSKTKMSLFDNFYNNEEEINNIN